MICKALSQPESLIELISELEGERHSPWRQAAFVCASRSHEFAGRKRLWIVPCDSRGAANVPLWLREHLEIFDELAEPQVIEASVVFAGPLPDSVHRYAIEALRPGAASARELIDAPKRQALVRDVRVLSGAAHIWVERLRVHTARGDVDEDIREEKLQKLAGRYWNKERENYYVPPKLNVVGDSPQPLADVASRNLLMNRPECLETGFVVIYGSGGAGKTFFLQHLADRFAAAASQSPTDSIPVFIQLAGVLHQYALENWLSQNGFGMLTLARITTLLRHGVIVPLLDALDEVVKGDARQGSNEFLSHIFSLAERKGRGRGLLACRDYYLTTDRAVVRDRAHGLSFPQLLMGPFDAQDTRRFLQLRTGLEPHQAKRWADALQREAKAVMGEEADLEVIRHPVVLETLAQYILRLPSGSRITSSDQFRLSRQDIFCDIVEELLKRERDKHLPLWQEKFQDCLHAYWTDPFEVEKQREVFKILTLTVAQDGGLHVPQDELGEFHHGLFLTTPGVAKYPDVRDALGQFLVSVAGRPQVAPTVPEERRDDTERSAIKHLSEAYAAHILAFSEAEPPKDLVFAFRHRFYFDYFLADALLEQMELALAARRGSGLVEWCLRHHITDSFATCLDFLTWDARVTRKGLDSLRLFLRDPSSVDETLAGYLVSLGLAIFLRRHVPDEERLVELLQFAPSPEMELLLMNEFLPRELSHFQVRSCTFPRLTLDSFDMRSVVLDSCDFKSLAITSKGLSKIAQCRFTDLQCDELFLGGNLIFSETILDIDGKITIGEGANIELYRCTMSDSVRSAFEGAIESGMRVKIDEPAVLAQRAAPSATQTFGRRFINKLMVLLRKEGHADFAVYQYKLRDRTPGTDLQFSRAIEFLEKRGTIRREGAMILLTDEGARNMYHPRFVNQAGYDAHDSYWRSIVEYLDDAPAV